MDLGLDFEDEDFQSKKKTTATTKTSYNVKICNPLWFEESSEDKDLNTKNFHNKFSADYHFYQDNYELASSKYAILLKDIPEYNTSLRQDVEESLCRCCIKLGRHKESMEIAHKLVQGSEFEARQRQNLLLLSQASKAAGDWAGYIRALSELADSQTHFPGFWLELARAFWQCSLSSGDPGLHKVEMVTCLVRSRLLLHSVQNTSVQVTRERNEVTIEQIDADLAQLAVSQEMLNKATEVISQDLECSNDLKDNGDCDGVEPVNTSVRIFDASRKIRFVIRKEEKKPKRNLLYKIDGFLGNSCADLNIRLIDNL